MANIEHPCNACGGDGIHWRETGIDGSHVCQHCGGDGIIHAGDIPALDDIIDRCNDILNKCNDIFEKLNE